MGIFDFLFASKNKSIEIAEDRIWMTAAAKFDGLAMELEDQLEKTQAVAVLLVAHFSDVLPQLERLAAEIKSKVPVSAALSSNLNSDLATNLRLDESSLIEIFTAERHPSYSKEQQFEAFVYQLPCRCRLVRHVSLDDPLMRVFADPWVKQVLATLDMPEDEPIKSKMVGRRITSAQRKIDESLLGEPQDTASAEEWLEKNCKPNT